MRFTWQGGGGWRNASACDSVIHCILNKMRRHISVGDLDGQGWRLIEGTVGVGLIVAVVAGAGIRGCPRCFVGLVGCEAVFFFACARFFLVRRCFPRFPVLAAYVVVGRSVGAVEGSLLGMSDGSTLDTVDGLELGMLDEMSASWCRAWRWLSAIGAKGDSPGYPTNALMRSWAAAVAAAAGDATCMEK
eukprot:scaffold22286_cov34-Attheya_sp.AAC.3